MKTEAPTTTELQVIPVEAVELLSTLPEAKSKEVSEFLADVFKGTQAWETQINAIEVNSSEDVLQIQLAETARKNIKKSRVDAEKLFDAKRSEVQVRMMSDTAEDKLWLKSKQIMQIKFKHLEELAEHKATYVIRIEQEKRKARTAERMAKMQVYNPNIEETSIRDLEDDIFEMLLSGARQKQFDAQKAKAEQEEKDRAEAEDQRIENERLKSEKETIIKRTELLAPYIVFIRDYSTTIALPEAEFEAEMEEIKTAAQHQWDFERDERQKEIDAQEEREAQIAKEKAEAEAKLKEQQAETEKVKADAEAAKSKSDAELAKAREEMRQKDQEAADKMRKDMEDKAQRENDEKEAKAKAQAAPIIEKLNAWIEAMQLATPPVSNDVTADIVKKFNGFKEWAKNQVNK